MKHVHYAEVEAEQVTAAGARDAWVRRLISEEDGAPHFKMRRFELEPGGRTPRHSHDWEHEVYILEGEGTVFGNGRENDFRPGDVLFIPGGQEHFFAADRGGPAAFLCLIPAESKA